MVLIVNSTVHLQNVLTGSIACYVFFTTIRINLLKSVYIYMIEEKFINQK